MDGPFLEIYIFFVDILHEREGKNDHLEVRCLKSLHLFPRIFRGHRRPVGSLLDGGSCLETFLGVLSREHRLSLGLTP